MTALLLDTNIVSYLIKNHPLAEQYRPKLTGNLLAISFMTVGELYEGAFRASWGVRKHQLLAAALESYTVIPSTNEVCRRWGEIRFLRRHQPISPEDAWIAAVAVEYKCPLVTHNPQDFDGIPGLKIISAPGGES